MNRKEKQEGDIEERSQDLFRLRFALITKMKSPGYVNSRTKWLHGLNRSSASRVLSRRAWIHALAGIAASTILLIGSTSAVTAQPTAITLSVDASTAVDGIQSGVNENVRSNNMRVTATLDGTARFSTAKNIAITVGKAGDSATEGTDYLRVDPINLTIKAGEASGFVEFEFLPLDDQKKEGLESVSVEGELDGVTVTGTSAYIFDDETKGTIILSTDVSKISEPVPGGKVEQEVTIAATLSTTSSTTRNATLRYTGTAKRRSGNDANDYAILGGTNFTIPKDSSTATKTVRIQTVDDNFWEKTETIRIGLAGVTGSVVPAEIELENKDPKPNVQIQISPDRFTEGHDGNVEIKAVLNGSLVQAPIAVRVTPDQPKINTDLSYKPASPWNLVIPAEMRAAKQTVKLKIPQDTEEEIGEVIQIQGEAKALSDSITVRRTQFRINSSGIITIAWRIVGQRVLPSGRQHQISFEAQVYGSTIPSGGLTVTFTPSEQSWFSPRTHTFRWEGGQTCANPNSCAKRATWSVTVPTLTSGTSVNFANPKVTGLDAGSYKLHNTGDNRLEIFLPDTPLGITRDLHAGTNQAPPGGRPFSAGNALGFFVIFNRPVSLPSNATLRLYLDSGRVEATCATLSSVGYPKTVRCTYRVGRQHYDLDRKIEVRAGALNFGGDIQDPTDSKKTWTAPKVPSKAIELPLATTIYGSGHAFEAKPTVQEGFREGAGEQILTVLMSDIGQRPAAQDIVIPITIKNGTTTSADWKLIQEGFGHHTQGKGRRHRNRKDRGPARRPQGRGGDPAGRRRRGSSGQARRTRAPRFPGTHPHGHAERVARGRDQVGNPEGGNRRDSRGLRSG